MTRDDVLKEFYATPAVPGGSSDRMADEIVRLRSILAALREPSMAVIAGAFRAGAVWDVVTNTRKTIQFAVAAAEQEVANDEG